MGELLQWLAELATTITQLSIVGGAVITILDKFILQPRRKRERQLEEKRRREHEERENKFREEMFQAISENNEPLRESIDRFNQVLDESVRDRENLNRITDENVRVLGQHGQQIDGLNERVIVLEVKTGVKNKGGDY